jgi:2'-hydroxyisoflavone reductase
MQRRSFIKQGMLITAGTFSLPALTNLYGKAKGKNILILGGTNFVGPALVKAFTGKGHSVTIFNRGITNPALFPDINRLRGDRTAGKEGLSQLVGKKWDAVIDTWPENPAYVDSSAQLLKETTPHYVFISSIVVYEDFKKPHIDELYPLKKADKFGEGKYATNKVLCENAVTNHFPLNSTIIRPGSIIGERDASYGFRFWTWRIKRGGEIIAPGDGKDIIQFVDVDDVAGWVVDCVERKLFGTYNTVGPEQYTSMQQFLAQCKQELNPQTKITWVSEQFIKENGLNTRQAMPLWNSLSTDWSGFEQISNQKAVSAGMKIKSLPKMIQDSFIHYAPDFKFGDRSIWGGISVEEETALLQKWKKSISG